MAAAYLVLVRPSVIAFPVITIAFITLLWWLFHMVRHRWLRVGLIAVGVVVAILLTPFSLLWGDEVLMRIRARRIAGQLEEYRVSHGKYPVSLLDISPADVNSRLQYQRDFDSPLVYHLRFGVGLAGATCEYDSRIGRWTVAPSGLTRR